MVIKNYHFETENNRPSHIIYLEDYESSNLKITKINCADRRVYHIDYFKNNNVMPFYLKVLDFYGYLEIINDKRILKIVKINLNDNFLGDYKKILNSIINNINEFYEKEYVFNDNYFKIIIDDTNKK